MVMELFIEFDETPRRSGMPLQLILDWLLSFTNFRRPAGIPSNHYHGFFQAVDIERGAATLPFLHQSPYRAIIMVHGWCRQDWIALWPLDLWQVSGSPAPAAMFAHHDQDQRRRRVLGYVTSLPSGLRAHARSPADPRRPLVRSSSFMALST